MLVPTCNRCGEPCRCTNYTFKIDEYTIGESRWDNLCTPDTRLDDFHLCYSCMNDFIKFIKEGKEDESTSK